MQNALGKRGPEIEQLTGLALTQDCFEEFELLDRPLRWLARKALFLSLQTTLSDYRKI